MENSSDKLSKPNQPTAKQILEDLQNPIFSSPRRKIIDASAGTQWADSNNILVYEEQMVDLMKKFEDAKDTLSRLDEELQLRTAEMKEKLSECQR